MSTVERPGSKAAPQGTRSGLKLKKARKAAPKAGKKPRKGKKAEPVVVTPELLAGVAPFNVLDQGLLARLAPRVEHVELARHEETGRLEIPATRTQTERRGPCGAPTRTDPDLAANGVTTVRLTYGEVAKLT